MKIKQSLFSAFADFFWQFYREKYMFNWTFSFWQKPLPRAYPCDWCFKMFPDLTNTPHSGFGCVELVDMIETYTDGIWLKIWLNLLTWNLQSVAACTLALAKIQQALPKSPGCKKCLRFTFQRYPCVYKKWPSGAKPTKKYLVEIYFRCWPRL